MKATDKRYFLDRAGDELAKARASDSADAAKAHFQLAGLFLDRAHQGRERKDVDRYLGAACSAGEKN
jgi:hypothetical protein